MSNAVRTHDINSMTRTLNQILAQLEYAKQEIERELEWVRMSPKARHAKSKARLSSYEKLMSEDVRQKEEKLEIFII